LEKFEKINKIGSMKSATTNVLKPKVRDRGQSQCKHH